MSFEVKEKDLLARIGKLKTKSGAIETPLLFPVVNPSAQVIAPSRIKTEFGFQALIANAYVLKKRFENESLQKGIHRLLDFDGVVMTDSGAYQILVYGDVDVSPGEIVTYQEQIAPDIATILDIPTGWKVTEKRAEQTVTETLKRARDFFKLKTRDDIVWVGPVQGGKYLDLVAKSAKEMGKLPFEIHALGSPTEVMERYRFDVLVDMILTAKAALPLEKPLHLFGAGHPFMLSLAVALGCDLFDSAAYALYARQGRYMTETGTFRLEELQYFPCPCPRCAKKTPKQVVETTQEQQQTFLAEHNLYVCAAELRSIKQAIKDGRLWEHLEMRAHGHPELLQALKRLKKHMNFLEKHAPSVKYSGLFFFDSVGLVRPEVTRYVRNLRERYVPPEGKKVNLLVPQTHTKPFSKSKDFRDLENSLQKLPRNSLSRIHVCFYVAPFGVVPRELDEVYPLSQHETVFPLDRETLEHVVTQVVEYVNRSNYETIILINDEEHWGDLILKACRKACLKRCIGYKSFNITGRGRKDFLKDLKEFLKES